MLICPSFLSLHHYPLTSRQAAKSAKFFYLTSRQAAKSAKFFYLISRQAAKSAKFFYLTSRQAAKSAKFFYGLMQGRVFPLAALRLGVSLYPTAINLCLRLSS